MRNSMSGKARTSIQARDIGQLTLNSPPPEPWKKLLVVAVVALLLGAGLVVVARWLDGGASRSTETNSTTPGITTASKNTTSDRIPDTTGNGPTAADGRVEGPVRSGEFDLGTSDSYDLDLGKRAYPSQGADFGLDSAEVYAPASGSLALPAGGQPADCLGRPAQQKVSVKSLPDLLCVFTDNGALATVHPSVSGRGLSATFELWEVLR